MCPQPVHFEFFVAYLKEQFVQPSHHGLPVEACYLQHRFPLDLGSADGYGYVDLRGDPSADDLAVERVEEYAFCHDLAVDAVITYVDFPSADDTGVVGKLDVDVFPRPDLDPFLCRYASLDIDAAVRADKALYIPKAIGAVDFYIICGFNGIPVVDGAMYRDVSVELDVACGHSCVTVYFQVVGDADPSVGVVYGAGYFRYEDSLAFHPDLLDRFPVIQQWSRFAFYRIDHFAHDVFARCAFRRFYTFSKPIARLYPVYELHFIKIHPAAFGHLRLRLRQFIHPDDRIPAVFSRDAARDRIRMQWLQFTVEGSGVYAEHDPVFPEQ